MAGKAADGAASISVPENVRFEQRDATEPWKDVVKFDYIHARAIMISFPDPKAVIQQAYDALAPGGYLEYGDPLLPVHYLGETPVDSALYKWRQAFHAAGPLHNRDLFAAHKYRQMFEEVGLEDIEERRFYWPNTDWPKGAYYKELAKYSHHNVRMSLRPVALKFFEVLGTSKAEREELCAAAEREVDEGKILGWNPM
jgi:SAM-dependent methyltransferase